MCKTIDTKLNKISHLEITLSFNFLCYCCGVSFFGS